VKIEKNRFAVTGVAAMQFFSVAVTGVAATLFVVLRQCKFLTSSIF